MNYNLLECKNRANLWSPELNDRIHNPGSELGYISYVLSLLHTRFLNDKSRFCDLSKKLTSGAA